VENTVVETVQTECPKSNQSHCWFAQ